MNCRTIIKLCGLKGFIANLVIAEQIYVKVKNPPTNQFYNIYDDFDTS